MRARLSSTAPPLAVWPALQPLADLLLVVLEGLGRLDEVLELADEAQRRVEHRPVAGALELDVGGVPDDLVRVPPVLDRDDRVVAAPEDQRRDLVGEIE